MNHQERKEVVGAMKLDLNLPALERLIGGDSEAEVNLRQQVVEEFAKKHIKNLVNTELTKKITSQVHKEMDDAIKVGLAQMATGDASWGGFSTIRNRLTEFAKSVAIQAVDEAIRDRVDKLKAAIPAEIERQVKASIPATIKILVDAEIQRRLKIASSME